jgi:signal transduction histidine kinase
MADTPATGGPELANLGAVTLDAPRPAGPAAIHGLPAVVLATSALFTAGLWAAGYPAWRIAVAAALLFSMTPRSRRATVPASPGAARPSLAPILSTATHVAVVAVTGGLRSPFLVAVVGPFTGMLQNYGWSGASRAALLLIAGSALAMGVLPAGWFGPPVADPAWSLLTVLTLVGVAVTNVWIFLALTRSLAAAQAEVDRGRTRMAEQALLRARELEQLSAQLSHELKNPLGAVKALVQLSARDAGEERARERLRVAEGEIGRMEGILREYLTFSRPFADLRLEPAWLGALADEVLLLLGTQASGAGVTLRRRGEARLEVDPRCLREALFNLVANGLAATPPGGSVEVDIAERDGVAVLAVRDSGRGMTREVLERVGTPFFTTREQGSGLGVALARAAFVQHGGSLEYASAEGQGTTATGTLPRARNGRSDGAAAAR